MPDTTDPELRVVASADWEAFRALRLRALADAPTAFGATLAEAEGQSEDLWRSRADGPGPLVMAFSSDAPVAMGGLFVPIDSDEAFVWGMWVAPDARGQGLGARILLELLDRARRTGRAVVLHVTEGNDIARRLYESHGFVGTGTWEPLRHGSDLQIEKLRLTS